MLPKIGVLGPTCRFQRVSTDGEEDIRCKISYLHETMVNRKV